MRWENQKFSSKLLILECLLAIKVFVSYEIRQEVWARKLNADSISIMNTFETSHISPFLNFINDILSSLGLSLSCPSIKKRWVIIEFQFQSSNISKK